MYETQAQKILNALYEKGREPHPYKWYLIKPFTPDEQD